MSKDNIVRLLETVEAKCALPELLISKSDPTATAKVLAGLISEQNDFLFNGYAPVRVVVEAGAMPRAVEVTVEAICVKAHEISMPVKIGKDDKHHPAALPRTIGALYLYGLEGQWGLKPFRGITTAPILDNDGGIRVADGYDDTTGLWCHNIPELNVPEEPTKADAEAALLRLRRLIRTFPFADAVRVMDPELGVEVTDLAQHDPKPAGLDESSYLVALITAVVRQSIDLAPAFLVDAPGISGAGTGKGLGVRAICVIASGVRPSAFTSGHDAAEFDKRLTSALIEAHPSVFLDNFNSKELTSDVLASVLTESPAMVRPMGHTKTVPLHTRTFIGVTGNSVEIAEDMARRIIKTSLDAKMEDPEQRKFEPGFLDRVLANRPALLSDALTIWRWGRKTVLKPGIALGSYEVWSRWCRDPLIALGMRDPVERLAEIKAADPKRKAAIEFFDVWWEAHKDATVKAKDIDVSIMVHCQGDKTRRSDDGSVQFSKQLAIAFINRHVGTRLGGYAFSMMSDKTRTRAVNYYKLQRTASEEK
jgi:hypothetical protein